jgi:hypothetical protein
MMTQKGPKHVHDDDDDDDKWELTTLTSVGLTLTHTDIIHYGHKFPA